MTREEILDAVQQVSASENGSFIPGGLHLNENSLASIKQECTLGLDGLMWQGLKIHITPALPDGKILVTKD